MIILLIACGLLTMGFALVSFKLYLLKKEVKHISDKLDTISQTEPNEKLTTSTFDTSMVALINQINRVLDKNKENLLETKQMESQLKQAITNISHDMRTPLTSAKG